MNQPKKWYFSKLILKYKHNIKKLGKFKEAIVKEKYKQNLPKKILLDEKIITKTKSIAENFNKYLFKLVQTWQKTSKSFTECIKKHGTTQPEKVLSVNKIRDAFFSLKINESAGYDSDDISFRVVRKCFGVLHKTLLHIFNLSLQTGTFPDKLRIARVTSLFEGVENYELGNYMPISLLPCLSKILEKIMYNRL